MAGRAVCTLLRVLIHANGDWVLLSASEPKNEFGIIGNRLKLGQCAQCGGAGYVPALCYVQKFYQGGPGSLAPLLKMGYESGLGGGAILSFDCHSAQLLHDLIWFEWRRLWLP